MADVTKRNEPVELFSDSDMTMVMTMVMMVMMMSMILPNVIQQTQSSLGAQSLSVKAQSFEGQEDPRYPIATNQLQWINLIYDYPFKPWVSAFIVNDGPSSVEIGINYPDDRFLMYPGETRTITRTGAEERISILFYICSPGLRANLRITGVY